jgi:hypothetical protein
MKWDETMSDSEVTRYVDWGTPSDANVKAMEMHFMAKSFIRDADSLADSYSAGQFVLFIFGIELALKAFLHERGFSLGVLRERFGHDLSELFQEQGSTV